MNIPPAKQVLFYQNLGRLFYAVAAADRTIRDEEVSTLKTIVNTEWLALNGMEQKSVVDAMRQLRIVFYQLKDQPREPNECLADFRSFKKANEDLFTDDVKQMIWKTASAIVGAFAGKNKSELIILAHLRAILQ